MSLNNLAYDGDRREERDEVYYRTRAIDGTGRRLDAVVVNVSPNGLMARCDHGLEPGVRLRFDLPGIADTVVAEVRWVLGGRIGCEFTAAIAPARYFPMLVALRR